MNPKLTKPIQLFVTAVFLVVTLLPPARAFAQEARGTITGKVTDAEKAVVPGASVTITNVAMGTSIAVKTNDDGFFRRLTLCRGRIRSRPRLRALRSTFATALILRVNDTLALDIQT